MIWNIFSFWLVLNPYGQYLIWYIKSMFKVHYTILMMHFMTCWMSSEWTMWSYILDVFVGMPGICVLIRIAGEQKSLTQSFREHWERLFSVFTNELFKPTRQSSSLLYTSSWDVDMIQICMALFWWIKSLYQLLYWAELIIKSTDERSLLTKTQTSVDPTIKLSLENPPLWFLSCAQGLWREGQ